MESNSRNFPFKDKLSANTSGEEFERYLDQLISDKDAEILVSEADPQTSLLSII